MKILPITTIKQKFSSANRKLIMPITIAATLGTAVSCSNEPKPYDQSASRGLLKAFNDSVDSIKSRFDNCYYKTVDEYLKAKEKCINSVSVTNSELYAIAGEHLSWDNTLNNLSYTDPNGCQISPKWGIDGNSQELELYAKKQSNINILNWEKKRYALLEQFKSDFEEIPILKDMNPSLLSKVLADQNVEKIEYVRTTNGVNNVFVTGGRVVYDIQFGKVSDNAVAGLLTKTYTDGSESELYIFKSEVLETNKSDKLRLTKMRVIQDGLEPNSPTKKKFEKQIQESGQESFYIAGTIPSNKLSSNGRLSTNGHLSLNGVKYIDKMITVMNPEGKVVSIYSKKKDILR